MVGTQLANYLIKEKLGEGGMGVVYKGVDLNLDRAVAIKTLPPQLARDQELVDRFRAEAKALANLNHVNIATVYNYLQVSGLHLMVLEYVAGETIDTILRRKRRIGCEEAVRMSKQALLGLGFAHRRAIIHRDIKPSNIMVTSDGIVKVMDFGIAKVLGSERLTRTGGMLGTLAYMSPEQIRIEPIDARSDIYSLSVTLYEMLSGHLPFSGKGEFELMSAHLNALPPRFNCKDVSGALESVVLKGLEKKPSARYQSAEEFGAALEQAIARPRAAAPVSQKAEAPVAAVPNPSPPRPVSPVPAVAAPQSPVRAAPQARLSPPATPSGLVNAQPANYVQTTGQRRTRNRIYAFACLVLGIAVLFSLFFGGLYNESVPMLLACVVLLYFLPVLIAAARLKHNGATVVRLNTLRGWTGIGWIQAMKQALAEDD